ncbi:MAG: phosphoglucosamine mutase [Actinomycetota bacterium]|nr:MAG: phosphoglucosamine mutase [Actinomycetota bacterium]
MGRLFGTDGVRGVYGRDLTDELAFALGRAVVAVLARTEPYRPVLVIGRDTRASGEPLERALAEGIRAAGADVILAGVVPTPAVAFLTVDLGAGAGAVISASHNPPEDNGIKFFGPSGYKLSDRIEDEIEAELARGSPASGDGEGRVREAPDALERYVRHLVGAAEARLDGMRIVVDCANGAACGVAPEVLRRLGAEVYPIFDAPDGSNINVGCGALHPEVVAHAVRAVGADAGVAHDGDADRAVFADAEGRVIDGDQVLAACALAMKEEGRLPRDLVVSTVMANLGLRRAMEAAGIELVQTRVGDRYVLEEMLARGAALGGEQSGHLVFAEHATTGDGILTAVRFLSLAARTGRSVAELARAMPRFPQVLENVPVAHKERLEEAEEVRAAVAEAERSLDGTGRVLVRASGTEPLVRVMVEAETEERARAVARELAEVVARALA